MLDKLLEELESG